MKTLVIGLGNPILGDDGVGWKVAEEVEKLLRPSPRLRHPSPSGRGDGDEGDTIVETAALGGLSLMERLIGYERVIIVDSMETGDSPVGSVSVFPLTSLSDPMAGHSASTHDATLMTALRTAEELGADIPKQIDIVAIEARNVYDFSEELSPAVAAAVLPAAGKVLELLNRN